MVGKTTTILLYLNQEGSMFYKVLEALDRLIGFDRARAHCDIPCGIYDPHAAQIGALTVIRMIDLMADMKSHPADSLEYLNNMPRYVMIKEEHAELVKREVRVIFGDYIKQEQLDKFPELPGLVHKIYQLGSKSRQTADRQVALDLLNAERGGGPGGHCGFLLWRPHLAGLQPAQQPASRY